MQTYYSAGFDGAATTININSTHYSQTFHTKHAIQTIKH